MGSLNDLRARNPHLHLKDASAPEFVKFGRLHRMRGIDMLGRLAGETIPMPEKGVVYKLSDNTLESDECAVRQISLNVYGGMPIQVGYCCGFNQSLNALEYHKGSELVITLTDVVLMLGDYRKLNFTSEGCSFNSEDIENFYVGKGTAVELYPNVLHFTPAQTGKTGFFTIVILPAGTNGALDSKPDQSPEGALLAAVNKWLISHPDMPYGYHGIKGANLAILD